MPVALLKGDAGLSDGAGVSELLCGSLLLPCRAGGVGGGGVFSCDTGSGWVTGVEGGLLGCREGCRQEPWVGEGSWGGAGHPFCPELLTGLCCLLGLFDHLMGRKDASHGAVNARINVLS